MRREIVTKISGKSESKLDYIRIYGSHIVVTVWSAKGPFIKCGCDPKVQPLPGKQPKLRWKLSLELKKVVPITPALCSLQKNMCTGRGLEEKALPLFYICLAFLHHRLFLSKLTKVVTLP